MSTTTTSDPPKVAHPSPSERAARGKAARAEVSRASHGEWAPARDRPAPLDLLAEQATTRVPELVPIRHGRMAASPFAFYRGAAAVMAADLAAGAPLGAAASSSAATPTWPTSAGSPRPSARWCSTSTTSTRRCPGPFEWDVKRLAASLEIAGRSRGFDDQGAPADRRRRRSASYREAMRDVRHDGQPRRLVRPPRHRTTIVETLGPGHRRRRGQAACSGPSPRPSPRTGSRPRPS